jgi:hypothetical protein
VLCGALRGAAWALACAAAAACGVAAGQSLDLFAESDLLLDAAQDAADEEPLFCDTAETEGAPASTPATLASEHHATLAERRARMGCPPRQFWVVNTRCAPDCSGFQRGLERITYWREEERGWVRYSREDFLLSMQASVPVTFYVHGNGLKERGAISAGRKIYREIGRGVPQFRLVLWSWPAEHRRGIGPIDNFLLKAHLADNQAYYLAWLIDQVDPHVPITVAGHSFGGRTVISTLHTLAVWQVKNEPLPPRQYTGYRPLQAAAIGAAIEYDSLLPGRRHQFALTQADRLAVTVNPRDRILRAFARIISAPVISVSGVPAARLPAEQRARLVQLYPSVGKAHRWTRYAQSPPTADLLRPYMIYFGAPAPLLPEGSPDLPPPERSAAVYETAQPRAARSSRDPPVAARGDRRR